ncbi:MAG: ATP-binding cassette domain-containing protein [Thermoplasmata archaeon]|nr:ATP-binding cassette domain-containing protein [Thermoplasmata archaeon]
MTENPAPGKVPHGPGEVVIDVRGLRMVYPPAKPGTPGTVAVDGIDFHVRRGEIFGFLGPNGAGKTTTISILTTLLRPTAGDAHVEGVDVVAHPHDVRRRLGLVFQKSTADEELTGRENLAIQAGLYGLAGEAVDRRISELLARMDLAAFADRFVKTYSGGMRRRLELAVGMVHEPKILFLDEPTLGLDPQGRAGFWKYIQSLRESSGITALMTTHYLEEADQLCDRIAVIDHGKIIALGTPKELKDSVGGDTLEISVAAGARELTPLLTALPGVGAVTRIGDTYRVKCSNGESLVPRAVLAAEQAGVLITGAIVRKPTLDEVFLELTGHAYRGEGELPSSEAADAPLVPPVGQGA